MLGVPIVKTSKTNLFEDYSEWLSFLSSGLFLFHFDGFHVE